MNLNKVIFISTCSNYGLMEEGRLATESSELKPLSTYAKAKVAIENQILALPKKIGPTPVILRFATAFGLSPRMRFDLTISEFTREAFLGNELLIYDAETWRPYCHVQDLSRIIRLSLEAPKSRVAYEVFNVGGEINNRTKATILEEIKKFIPSLKVKLKEHGSDPRNYRVDFSKIRKHLLFEPTYKVSDGIAELLEELKQGRFADYDQRKNFYGNYAINDELICHPIS